MPDWAIGKKTRTTERVTPVRMSQQKVVSEEDYVRAMLGTGPDLSEEEKKVAYEYYAKPPPTPRQPVVEEPAVNINVQGPKIFGEQIDLMAIRKSALIESVKAVLKQDFKYKFADIDEYADEVKDDLFKQICQAVQKKKNENKKEKGNYCLVTINAREGVIGDELMEGLKKMGKHDPIRQLKSIYWTLEHRWPEGRPEGAHIHMLIERDPELGDVGLPYRIEKAFKSVWSDWCDTSNLHCLNFKWSKEIGGFQNYLLGIKSDLDKDERVDLDRKWLQDRGLSHCMRLAFGQSENKPERPTPKTRKAKNNGKAQ